MEAESHPWSSCVSAPQFQTDSELLANMKSFCLLSLILPVLSVQDSAPLGCGSCDLAQCAPLPAEGCAAGSLVDSCGCCSVCAAAEGELCGGRRSAARRCGSGLECVRSGENKKNKMGVCVCKNKYEVCGTNGVTYTNTCALKTAGLRAQSEGKESVNMQNKGRCGSGEVAGHGINLCSLQPAEGGHLF